MYESEQYHEITQLSERLGEVLSAHQQTVACAESCTGGGIAQAITRVAGSSAWFGYGFVTYANEAKVDLLQVPAEIIQAQGAVSEAVAAAMALRARVLAKADYAVAVSGVAGPGGGSEDKPVGTVCFAWALPSGAVNTETCLLPGDRAGVRQATEHHALSRLLELIQ